MWCAWSILNPWSWGICWGKTQTQEALNNNSSTNSISLQCRRPTHLCYSRCTRQGWSVTCLEVGPNGVSSGIFITIFHLSAIFSEAQWGDELIVQGHHCGKQLRVRSAISLGSWLCSKKPQGLMRWLSGLRRVLPNLRTWVQSLHLSGRKREVSYTLVSDHHTYAVAHIGHIHKHTINNKN